MDTIVLRWENFGSRGPHYMDINHLRATSLPERKHSPAKVGPFSLLPWPEKPGQYRTIFMSQTAPKKRRLSSHQTEEDYERRHAEQKKLAREVESSQSPSSGKSPEYRPTYRAAIAKFGFLPRQTLGSGSYSKVKLALDINGKYGDRVAIKIIDRLKAPSDYQKKFLPRELEIWPHLNHLHLIKLYEVQQDERRVYMILEYAPGGDVLKYIQEHGAVDESLARKWFMQVADAVRYMHDKGITHRDLKLENLLLDREQNVKICDFGFVKPNCTKDLSNTYCGSKSYAAPEILLGRPYQPTQSDVWAMGVILYIIVTGKMPFDETKGTKSILEEQRNLVFRWPRTKRVSSECQDLILRMFTWSFASRPSVHQVLMHTWFHPPRVSSAYHHHRTGHSAVDPRLDWHSVPEQKVSSDNQRHGAGNSGHHQSNHNDRHHYRSGIPQTFHHQRTQHQHHRLVQGRSNPSPHSVSCPMVAKDRRDRYST